MAEQDLEIKLKVDASQVSNGTNEAKNKVKQAANEMENEVKSSSSSMEQHLDKVAESAKNIGDAANQAGNEVQKMEQQVASSSARMSKDLGGVAEQLKGISARQVAGVASRGLGIAGNAVKWVGENFTEEGSEERTALDVAGGALQGAGQGVMLGAAIGSVVPVVGTAVGAAVGGAVGALAGAASELWDASEALKKEAEERQQSAEKSLRDHATDLKERDRLAGYERENQVLLGGIGKTWWQGKDGTSISGEERIFKVQESRQEELNRLTKERDDYIREHRDDTGEDAVEAASYLSYLDKAVMEAEQHLAALAPVVQAAQRSIAEQQKAEDAKARAAEQEAAAAEANAQKMTEAAARLEETRLKDEQRTAEHTLADYERQLQGVISKPAETPSDALTRIGGGGGYASYNNSTAQIQKSIETNLRTLINDQKAQVDELKTAILSLKNDTFKWG